MWHDVLILDQFHGLTWHDLRQMAARGTPARWADLVAEFEAGQWHASGVSGVQPRRATVGDNYAPAWCELVYRATPDGGVEIWRSRVDSSG